MYKICHTEESSRRQRELELGLQSLMLQRRYEDISVSDLCAQMEIPRKSFYRYFSSKEGCLFALVDHTLIEFFQAQLSADAELSGTQIGDLGRYFRFWRERGDLLEALQRNGLAGIELRNVDGTNVADITLDELAKKITHNHQMS